MAIKWFEGKTEFQIPEYRGNGKFIPIQKVAINPEQTRLEYRQLQRIIPDVRLQTVEGFEFAIEIFVTSDITDKKKKDIDSFGLPTLRIDLSIFYRTNSEKCRIDKEFIENNLDRLLTTPGLKEWVKLNPENVLGKLEIRESKEFPTSPNTGCMTLISLLFFVILLVALLA